MGNVIPGVYDILQKTGVASTQVNVNVNFIVGESDAGPDNEIVVGGLNLKELERLWENHVDNVSTD